MLKNRSFPLKNPNQITHEFPSSPQLLQAVYADQRRDQTKNVLPFQLQTPCKFLIMLFANLAAMHDQLLETNDVKYDLQNVLGCKIRNHHDHNDRQP